MKRSKMGRPRSSAVCPSCGAMPCHQRPSAIAPADPQPAAVAEPEQRHWYATIRLPNGGVRDLFMHRKDNARAAHAAIGRDPTLVEIFTPDATHDWPPEQDWREVCPDCSYPEGHEYGCPREGC